MHPNLSVTGQLDRRFRAVRHFEGLNIDANKPVRTCFRSKVDQIQDIVTGNPTVVKMVVNFNREARVHNALRQLLAPVVKDIIEDKTLGINTNPVDVYMTWVNQLEMSTGEARYERKCTYCTPQICV